MLVTTARLTHTDSIKRKDVPGGVPRPAGEERRQVLEADVKEAIDIEHMHTQTCMRTHT